MTDLLPAWCRLIRADNPGPMTLDGTNTYVVTGADGTIVVDPGPLLESHLAAVAAVAPVTLVLLTHHHPDHAAGAARFHELTGAPVLARDPDLCLGGQVLPDDGGVLDAGDVRLRVVDTPGHTADSVSFLAEDDIQRTPSALFSGDTVLGRGTTVVMHPDGELGCYLASLATLRALVGDGCVLLPGHGPVLADAAIAAQQYIDHRHQRLAEVRRALATGVTTAREVVEIVYADVDRAVWPAAELTVEAALAYLRDGEPI